SSFALARARQRNCRVHFHYAFREPDGPIAAGADLRSQRPHISSQSSQYFLGWLRPVELLDHETANEAFQLAIGSARDSKQGSRPAKIGDWLWIDDMIAPMAAHERRGDIGSSRRSGQTAKQEIRIASPVAVARGAAHAGAGCLAAKQERRSKGDTADRH